MRLIDADTLVKDLLEQIPLAENVPIFKDIIESQSTTYDVDKVLKQLEDESKKCSICELPTCKEDESHCCYCNGLNKAIEIVKAGGMNNNSKTSD